MAFRIPPGGFAGFAQMTPASRLALQSAMPTSGNGTKRRRARTSAAKRGRTSAKSKRARTGRKLKFGSPAWRKKYMKNGGRKRRRG